MYAVLSSLIMVKLNGGWHRTPSDHRGPSRLCMMVTGYALRRAVAVIFADESPVASCAVELEWRFILVRGLEVL